MVRPIHPDFLFLLELKDKNLVSLFKDLRNYILEQNKDSNELLYHTHALTAVFSVSDKLQDAYCMIPVYSNYLNLGFNKGTLLHDPYGLLTGTGNLIRHIDITCKADYRNTNVRRLINDALKFSLDNMDRPTKSVGQTISKIKKR